MSNYKLINPRIEGTLSTIIRGDSDMNAAEKIWHTLSKYVTNNVPQFAFTLEDMDNNNMHHFVVKETLVGGNSVKWDIDKLDLDLDAAVEKKFLKNVNSAKMSGGKKHRKHRKHREHRERKEGDDDSSSSSSSSSSSDEMFSALKLYKNQMKTFPITYWWYDPWVYQLDSIYIPTFTSPMNPYIEVTTVNYYP